MDPQRFDAIARAFATPRTRRGFIGGLAAVAGLIGIGPAATASCRESGGVCREHGNCCTGVCLPVDRNGRQRCAKALGERATTSAECASGIVADGVCCNAACGGQCEACNLPGEAGTCSPVSGAPVNGHAACAGSGACKGFCDGVNRTGCAFPQTNTACGSPTCDSGSGQATVYTCNGSGSCTSTVSSCGLYVCGGSSCKGSCGSDGDCIGAAYCNGGVCTSDRGIGQSCDRRDQCQSGACVNGVCCASASCPECQSCAAGGGSCAPDASLNNTTCSSGTCQNGTCGCSLDQKLCGTECIGLLACCTDDDCGYDSICKRAACNTTTHTCEVVNADTDPRCVTDACATRSCVNGVCNEVAAISVCGICETPVSPCNPAAGPQCAPKVCNSPGACQSGPGTCIPAQLGCVYPSTCAACQTCQNGQCVDNCPPTANGCADGNAGICNTTTGDCDYRSRCSVCEFCQFPNTCTYEGDGFQAAGGTCCDGVVVPATEFCPVGACPHDFVDVSGTTRSCCGETFPEADYELCCSYPNVLLDHNTCCSPGSILVEDKCCPAGTVAVCGGPIDGLETCCPEQCRLSGVTTYCP